LRVGGLLLLALGLMAAACDAPKPEPAPAPVAAIEKPKAVSREAYAVPVEDRPVLGKIGDTSCEGPDNELILNIDETGCLFLLKDTIRTDDAAISGQVRHARVRLSVFQPGLKQNGETLGWILFATRTHCTTRQFDIMGNVNYRPDGVEISRTTPMYGPRTMENPDTTDKLFKAVCDG
jgi:hypothetical protein